LGHCARLPSPWRGSSEQISLDPVGWEARKTPAEGDVFFLDFYLYRTSQDLAKACWMEPQEHCRCLSKCASTRKGTAKTIAHEVPREIFVCLSNCLGTSRVGTANHRS